LRLLYLLSGILLSISPTTGSAGPSPALQKQQQDIQHKIDVMRACQTTPKQEKAKTIAKLDQQLSQVDTAIDTQQSQADEQKKAQSDGTSTFIPSSASGGGALPLVNIVV
jgi:hypothetical protein